MRIHGIFSEIFSDFGYMSSEEEAIIGLFLLFLILILGICLITSIFNIVARWIFFNKCGEKGWKAIIPVYDEITLLKLSGMHWWWIFILYAASFVSLFQTTINIATETTSSIVLGIVSLFISFLTFIASIATILTKINESINLAKKFNKNGGYGVLIFFFEPIMFLILGLSKNCEYDKDAKVSPNGFFGGNK